MPVCIWTSVLPSNISQDPSQTCRPITAHIGTMSEICCFVARQQRRTPQCHRISTMKSRAWYLYRRTRSWYHGLHFSALPRWIALRRVRSSNLEQFTRYSTWEVSQYRCYSVLRGSIWAVFLVRSMERVWGGRYVRFVLVRLMVLVCVCVCLYLS